MLVLITTRKERGRRLSPGLDASPHYHKRGGAGCLKKAGCFASVQKQKQHLDWMLVFITTNKGEDAVKAKVIEPPYLANVRKHKPNAAIFPARYWLLHVKSGWAA